MKIKVCPQCGNGKFLVLAIQRHDWIVDGDGYFISDEGCYDSEVVSGNQWDCTECGATYESNDELKEVENE